VSRNGQQIGKLAHLVDLPEDSPMSELHSMVHSRVSTLIAGGLSRPCCCILRTSRSCVR
jgi:hypothetical protein